MQQRMMNSNQIEFRKKRWSQVNESGARPVGDNVLILVDEAIEKSVGGIIIPNTSVADNQMRAETGTIVAMGAGAFFWNSERSRPYEGDDKPKIGDHIMFSRYAGRIINGNDGNQYRLVLDKEIGAVATDDGFTVLSDETDGPGTPAT
jgi:co-chaperonin GroES (HSP10)